MKICRVCNKEIINSKKRVYCSEECQATGIKLANKISKEIEKQKYIKSKANWSHAIIEIGKIKHKKTIPINKLGFTNSISTHLKWLLREYNLTVKENVKMIRCDGMNKDFMLVVVTPKIIKTLFEKRYEIYKDNFRLDCLRTVKTLVKVFDKVNDYYDKDKKVTLGNNK